MNPKPSDFFLSFVEFFSILVPGALVCFLFADTGASHLLNGSQLPTLATPPEKWVAFAIASYVLGHFLSTLGNAVLDPIYDSTYVKYKRSHDGDKLRQYVKQLRKQTFADVGTDLTNNLSWASAVVHHLSPAGAAEVDRYEASFRLFRSLVLVLFAIMGRFAMQKDVWLAVITFALMLVTFWRYSELRWDRAQCIYLYFVVFCKQAELPQAAGKLLVQHSAADKSVSE